MPTIIETNLLIVDPASPPIPNGIVVVNGERVLEAGNPEEVEVSGNWTRIDCSGWTVMPGMIDSHTHVTVNNRFRIPLSDHFEVDEATATLRGAMNLRSDLASGVTTMRALGDRPGAERAFQTAIERKEAVGPRLQVCVRALRPSHGTAPFLSCPADGNEELTARIGENADSGADWTKLFITNVREGDTYEDYLRGDLTDVSAYSRDEIECAIEVSHALGIPVAAHAIGGEAMRWAMELGIDSVEHANLLQAEDVALFVKTGTFLSDPNLQLFFDAEVGFESFQSWEWPWWRARVEQARELTANHLPEAIAAGVKVCLGSDSTHATMWREAVALVGLGVSPVEALKAITVHSAEMMGMADRIGRLKQNYIADLIVVEGNPLEDIESLRRIRRVMKGGKWVGNTLEGAGKLFCD